MPETTVDKIVAANVCCGCGTCAGICPSDCLRMTFNRYGEYQPIMVNVLNVACALRYARSMTTLRMNLLMHYSLPFRI